MVRTARLRDRGDPHRRRRARRLADRALAPAAGLARRCQVTLNVSFYGAIAAQLARGLAFWLEYDFLHTDFQAAPAVQTHVLSLTGQVTR
jgi:hypothetical protein